MKKNKNDKYVQFRLTKPYQKLPRKKLTDNKIGPKDVLFYESKSYSKFKIHCTLDNGELLKY